jgi:hypothetical protein
MKIAAAALLLGASLTVPATACADCGDPGQDPCTGPVPTVDQVVGIMEQLTDPNIPAMSKGTIVTPGFTPEEAAKIDDHLHRMDVHGGELPLPFIATDIQPAPNNFAGATIATGGGFLQWSPPGPIVLVNQSGHWLLTHHSAMSCLNAYWWNVSPHGPVAVPHG